MVKWINLILLSNQVLAELIETEQKYVKDLHFLMSTYLEPIKGEKFLSSNDLEVLYRNVDEIVTFQKKFLRILEECLEADPGFNSYTSINQFQVRLRATFCVV